MRRRLFSCLGWPAAPGWHVGTLADAMRTAMAEAQARIDGRAGTAGGSQRPAVLIEEVSMTVGVISAARPLRVDQDIALSLPVTSAGRGRWHRFLDRLFGRIVQPIIITVHRNDTSLAP